jgi:hypothetical protein
MMIYFERLPYSRRSEILKKSLARNEGDRQTTQSVFNTILGYTCESCCRY